MPRTLHLGKFWRPRYPWLSEILGHHFPKIAIGSIEVPQKSLSCVCWVRNRALRRFLDAWDHGPKRALTRPHVPTKYWVLWELFIRCELMPFVFWAVRLVGLVTFRYLLAWSVGDTYTSYPPRHAGVQTPDRLWSMVYQVPYLRLNICHTVDK
jgi:hypothetical protein